jgi:hypothetical protein
VTVPKNRSGHDWDNKNVIRETCVSVPHAKKSEQVVLILRTTPDKILKGTVRACRWVSHPQRVGVYPSHRVRVLLTNESTPRALMNRRTEPPSCL